MITRNSESKKSALDVIGRLIESGGDRLSEESSRVLKSFLNDDRTQALYENFGSNDDVFSRIVITSLESHDLFNRFDVLVQRHKEELADFVKLISAKNRLEKFVASLELQNSVVIEARLWVTSEHIWTMKYSLYLIETALSDQKRIAIETLGRIGATRKSKISGAAKTAALGWLAEGVRRVCGQPHHEEITTLADVIFGGEHTDDQVRAAERTRQGRNWRL